MVPIGHFMVPVTNALVTNDPGQARGCVGNPHLGITSCLLVIRQELDPMQQGGLPCGCRYPECEFVNLLEQLSSTMLRPIKE